MKYKRNKLIISSLIFLVGLWMNIYFSANLHFLLTKKMEVLSLVPIKDCITSMATSKAHLSLFLCMQGFIVLFVIFYYIANHKPYQSELVEITPQLSTPVSAGQKQFGSAKWLMDKEKDTVFKSFILDDIDEKNQLPKIESGGIVIGCNKKGKGEKIYYIDDDTHTLCIGATRSGKTRTVVLQTIGTIGLAGESMILSDPKGGATRSQLKRLRTRGVFI